MSRRLVSHSADLQRLRNEGLSVDIVGGKLVVRDIPFVDGAGLVHIDGMLVMSLELAGENVKPPADHTASFGGGIPCRADGRDLTTVVNGRGQRDLGDGIVVDCSCSMKPDPADDRFPGGKYPDFHSKVTRYVAAIAGQAAAVAPSVTAAVFKPVPTDPDDGPFLYVNTASSRAGIDALNAILRPERLAIVGLGGTGEYILDYVAKTEVESIDVFDGDELRSHNAFRAPGTVSLPELNASPTKVDHFVAVYSQIRTGIEAHPYDIDESNVGELDEMTFVFVAIDDAIAKKPIIDHLLDRRIPFVDVGMGVEQVNGHLTGSLRTTLVTSDKNDHVDVRIPVDDVDGPDEYRTNIQIAELNARNAADAVIAWKKYRGFYADLEHEHSSIYNISTNHIVNTDHQRAG